MHDCAGVLDSSAKSASLFLHGSSLHHYFCGGMIFTTETPGSSLVQGSCLVAIHMAVGLLFLCYLHNIVHTMIYLKAHARGRMVEFGV